MYELDPPPYSVDITKKQLRQIYHDMTLIRFSLPKPASPSTLLTHG